MSVTGDCLTDFRGWGLMVVVSRLWKGGPVVRDCYVLGPETVEIIANDLKVGWIPSCIAISPWSPKQC